MSDRSKKLKSMTISDLKKIIKSNKLGNVTDVNKKAKKKAQLIAMISDTTNISNITSTRKKRVSKKPKKVKKKKTTDLRSAAGQGRKKKETCPPPRPSNDLRSAGGVGREKGSPCPPEDQAIPIVQKEKKKKPVKKPKKPKKPKETLEQRKARKEKEKKAKREKDKKPIESNFQRLRRELEEKEKRKEKAQREQDEEDRAKRAEEQQLLDDAIDFRKDKELARLLIETDTDEEEEFFTPKEIDLLLRETDDEEEPAFAFNTIIREIFDSVDTDEIDENTLWNEFKREDFRVIQITEFRILLNEMIANGELFKIRDKVYSLTPHVEEEEEEEDEETESPINLIVIDDFVAGEGFDFDITEDEEDEVIPIEDDVAVALELQQEADERTRKLEEELDFVSDKLIRQAIASSKRKEKRRRDREISKLQTEAIIRDFNEARALELQEKADKKQLKKAEILERAKDIIIDLVNEKGGNLTKRMVKDKLKETGIKGKVIKRNNLMNFARSLLPKEKKVKFDLSVDFGKRGKDPSGSERALTQQELDDLIEKRAKERRAKADRRRNKRKLVFEEGDLDLI